MKTSERTHFHFFSTIFTQHEESEMDKKTFIFYPEILFQTWSIFLFSRKHWWLKWKKNYQLFLSSDPHWLPFFEQWCFWLFLSKLKQEEYTRLIFMFEMNNVLILSIFWNIFAIYSQHRVALSPQRKNHTFQKTWGCLIHEMIKTMYFQSGWW